VTGALDAGLRTPDIYAPGSRKVGTAEIGEAVLAALRAGG
jgi:3-isopropylmalate dehydrogenase